LDNQVALTDDERDKLRQKYEQQSCELDMETASSLSACNEFTSVRAQADRLARRRATRLEAVEKKEKEKIKVICGHCVLSFYCVLSFSILSFALARIFTKIVQYWC